MLQKYQRIINYQSYDKKYVNPFFPDKKPNEIVEVDEDSHDIVTKRVAITEEEKKQIEEETEEANHKNVT